MVMSIERVLKEKVERRTLEGFDYKAPIPARNTEFSRQPLAWQVKRTNSKKKVSSARGSSPLAAPRVWSKVSLDRGASVRKSFGRAVHTSNK